MNWKAECRKLAENAEAAAKAAAVNYTIEKVTDINEILRLYGNGPTGSKTCCCSCSGD